MTKSDERRSNPVAAPTSLTRSSWSQGADRSRLAAWTGVALAYLVVRFGLSSRLDAISAYASYFLEVIVVILVIVFGRRSARIGLRPQKTGAYGALLGAAAGFAIHRVAGLSGIGIPFDLKSTETLVFLVFVAPILEEAIFRFVLWRPIEWLTGRPGWAWVVTTLLFSYAHLHVIWFLPEAVSETIRSFIVYQTAYTLGLGALCGFYVYRSNNLTGAMIVHFAFNFGFLIASLS